MRWPNRNALWAQAVAEELERSGVRDVCVSPGSRSTPLVLALHARKALRITTHLDERSGAFFGLGIAKATGRPAAILCTSGTAAANFLPAVVEASEAGVPLVVLTADRPPELRGVGANQSIDQDRLFGVHVRLFANPGIPQVTDERLRHLRGLVCRAVAAARSPHPGPVHLNFPFQEPLVPAEVAGDVPDEWAKEHPLAVEGRADGRPFIEIPTSSLTIEDAAIDEAAQRIENAARILLVAGPGTEAEGALRLSARLKAPILCDPLSGLRFRDSQGAARVSTYDGWLADPEIRRRIAPDLVLRFGAAPTSKALLQALAQWASADQILVDPSMRRAEPTHQAALVLGTTPSQACEGLHGRVAQRLDGSYSEMLLDLERASASLYAGELPKRPFEGSIMARLVERLPAGATLWVGSSLPVRDLDRFACSTERPLRVLANRGASGIDGVLSSALGAAYALRERVVLVLGDVSFLHDLSGAVAATRLGIALDVVVFHNDGGGIFEFLPVRDLEPPFTELFVTPHGVDLTRVAEALGWDARDASVADLPGFLASGGTRPRLLTIRTDRQGNVTHRRALEALLRDRLRLAPTRMDR